MMDDKMKEQLEKIAWLMGVGHSAETRRQIRQASDVELWLYKIQMYTGFSQDQCEWLRMLVLDVAGRKGETTLIPQAQWLDRLMWNIESQVGNPDSWGELAKMIGDYKTFVENPSFMPQMPELPAWINLGGKQ